MTGKLQNVQKRAARLIKGFRSRERITPALTELHYMASDKSESEIRYTSGSLQGTKVTRTKISEKLLRVF